jgi:hypothetical protein
VGLFESVSFEKFLVKEAVIYPISLSKLLMSVSLNYDDIDIWLMAIFGKKPSLLFLL